LWAAPAHPTDVRAWIAPRKDAGAQQRVDRIVSRIRSGESTGGQEPPPLPPPGQLRKRLSEELAYATRLLEQLGDLLADDPTIIARHPTHLQTLDIVSKMIGHVSGVIAAEDMAEAIASIGMENMRARLLRR
jgi:hypothetical protein